MKNFTLSRFLGVLATATVVAVLSAGSVFAQSPPKKVLVLGDTGASGNAVSSTDYFNAATKEMQDAVGAANVTAIGGIDVTDLNAAQLQQGNGDAYDIIVLTAVFGGVTANNRNLLEQAIKNRAAGAFFLFPDQCTVCATNVDNITVPFVQNATGWAIAAGTNNAVSRSIYLNQNSTLKDSFSNFPTLYVADYTDLRNVPVNNALYFRSATPIPVGATLVNEVAAMIVPRSQSYLGNGSCIFVVSDVNTLVGENGSAVNVGLGAAMVNAVAQSCSVDEGGIAITKSLAMPAGVTGPFDFKFEATCDKPAAGTVYPSPTLSYPTATTVVIPYIPAGANCSVKEILPPPPANYTWVAPADQTVPAIAKDNNQPVTFTNQLQALPGTIHITKQLALPAGVSGPLALSFSASCDAGGTTTQHGPVTINYPSDTSADIANIPGNAQCRVTETLPAPPSGYSWAPVAPVDVTVPANAPVTAAFANALNPVPLGVLRITHSLNAPASFTGTLPVAVSATCTLPAAGTVYGPFTLNAPTDSAVDIPNIPQGAACTVSQQLPAAPTGFAWGTPSIAPATITIAAASGSAVAITNSLTANTAPAGPQPVPVGNWAWLLGAGLALAAAGATSLGRRRQP